MQMGICAASRPGVTGAAWPEGRLYVGVEERGCAVNPTVGREEASVGWVFLEGRSCCYCWGLFLPQFETPLEESEFQVVPGHPAF